MVVQQVADYLLDFSQLYASVENHLGLGSLSIQKQATGLKTLAQEEEGLHRLFVLYWL